MVPRALETTNGQAHAAEVSNTVPPPGVQLLPSIGVSELPAVDRTDKGPSRGRRHEAVARLTLALAERAPPRSRARAPPSRCSPKVRLLDFPRK
jgi:hypothetical protein